MQSIPFRSHPLAGCSKGPVRFLRAALPALLFGLFTLARPSAAENATLPGVVSTPYPTITNLAVKWLIAGDDNLNGVVTVEYRPAGEAQWRQGMPLRRIPADISIATDPIFSWPNQHSGSIFDLRPDTEYEIKLTLRDPDGGSTERTVQARTRAVPRPFQGGTVKSVTPATFYNAASTALPGDILQLAPGNYGTFYFGRSGETGKYITIRAALAGTPDSVVFSRFSLASCKHVILEGVTVNGKVDLLGAEDVAVRRCTVNAEFGIQANRDPGATNCYIADNVVSFTYPWAADKMAVDGGFIGEGIQITGPGNVICYNRVKSFTDCISLMEDRGVANQYCIDIYNNDISVGLDDAIEADFSQGNCRVMRNRITNSFMALSSQPSLGGPTYFIRNVIYNIIDCPFKLARYSKGDVVLHNTVMKVGDGFRVIHNPSRAYFRNNLFLGGSGGGNFGKGGAYTSGDGRAIEFPNADATSDLDYDGVGTYETLFIAKIDGIKTYNIQDLRAQTTEKHAVLTDLNTFAVGTVYPSPPIPERQPSNLTIRPGSVAEDAGLAIPNINDNYTGAAPDLGASELGRPLAHYGPRPIDWPDEQGVYEKNCDFSGDGRISISDVIFMLLEARVDPSNPRLDWDGDGFFTIADAVAMLNGIVSGTCDDSPAHLAAADIWQPDARLGSLTFEEMQYVERMLGQMRLSPDEAAAFEAALHGANPGPELPRAFSLEQNYPNPFNPSTTIRYNVQQGNTDRVVLEVFDLQGRLVRTLADGVKEGGSYSVFWDGTDQMGRGAASGVYFSRLRSGIFSQTRKMVLLK
jgi:hypothetical protein